MFNSRIKIFTGHFGSGKTELAINFAVNLRQKFENVAISDLDTINPYFRSRNLDEMFTKADIKLIAPPKKFIQADLPIVSAKIYKYINDESCQLIVDAGGDHDGAKALGQYYHDWKSLSPEVIFVLNARRPYVSTLDGALRTINEIESAVRLPVTSIINNTNLGGLTTVADILDGIELSLELEKKTNITFTCSTVFEDLVPQVQALNITSKVLPIKRFMTV